MRLRDIMPKSLFGRSLIILGLPIILLQIVLTYFFFERHWQDVGRRLILSVAGEIAHISNQINQVYQEPQKINKIYVNGYDHFGASFQYSPSKTLPNNIKQHKKT